MNVLITGGAGFIGSALARRLAARGDCAVSVLDNLSPQIHGALADFSADLKSMARCIKADVTEARDWAKALEGQDAVFHLAAETGTGQSMYEMARYTNVNVTGTALLFEALRRGGRRPRKVVIASSRAVYGEGKYECTNCGTMQPTSRSAKQMQHGDFEIHCSRCNTSMTPAATEEAFPLHPVSVYAATKVAQEHLAYACQMTSDTAVACLRFQNVYGPGQSLRNPYTGILSIFSDRILNGQKISVFEDGSESRDFVYIDDVVDAMTAVVELDLAPWTVLNIGTGVPTSVSDVVRTLLRVYGAETPWEISGQFRLGDIRHNYADIRLAERELGFKARWSLEKGLGELCAWVRQSCPPPIDLDGSFRELERHGLLGTALRADRP